MSKKSKDYYKRHLVSADLTREDRRLLRQRLEDEKPSADKDDCKSYVRMLQELYINEHMSSEESISEHRRTEPLMEVRSIVLGTLSKLDCEDST